MNVLVIDDDPNKVRQLVSFVSETYPDATVDERHSYQSGLKAALLAPPDIVLLDMTMPTYDVAGKEKGGRERRYAGTQILRQFQRKHLASRVIIVTQFERFGEGPDQVTLAELRQRLTDEFSGQYHGTVFYQAADTQWKADLRKLLGKLMKKEGGADAS